MDVSKKQQTEPPITDVAPTGQELIQQLVSASGLPEDAVHQELDEICAIGGQDPRALTLEELRQAMLIYLEKLEMEANASGLS